MCVCVLRHDRAKTKRKRRREPVEKLHDVITHIVRVSMWVTAPGGLFSVCTRWCARLRNAVTGTAGYRKAGKRPDRWDGDGTRGSRQLHVPV